MKGFYELFIKIIQVFFFVFFEHFVKREQVVFNTYLKEKILSLFIVGTFSHWL